MADAAARREARRRKILENSGNRLLKIAGKCSDEGIRDSPNRSIKPIPEPEYEIPLIASSSSSNKTLPQNGALFNEPEQFLITQPGREIYATGDGQEPSDLAHLLPPAESAGLPTVTLWEKLSSHKYDIVLLSMFIQILYGLSVITFDRNGYFFLPVIVYIVTKLVWFPVKNNTSNLANLLLLLNGMSQSKVGNIMYVTQTISVIFRDTFVYLFTTICIQSLCVTVQDSLVT